MNRVRRLLNHIATQLGGLTLSQRLAIGLCAALVAVSLLWLMQWSTTPEMIPLVAHDFAFDDLDAAEEALRNNGIRYQLYGSRIYVRDSDRHNALRLVHAAEALPDGSLFDMAAVVTDDNPFQSPEARAYAQNYAKGNELAKIIGTSPYVKKASVIVNPASKRRLGGVGDVPSASVTVTLAAGREMTQEVVEGFAKLVSGAVAGLKPHNVYITDARTLRSHSMPHPDDAAGFDLLSIVKRREEHYRTKILSKLADIPGVQVAVTVELDTSKRVTQNIKHDVPQPRVEQTSSTEQSAGSQATEPGVQANLGQAISGAIGGQTQSIEESKTENFEPKLSQTETVEHFPFATRKVTAAIGIPRSFLQGVLQSQRPDAKDQPRDDDPAFTAVRDAQVARVKSSVARIVMAKSPDDVEVDVYPDGEWTADGGGWSRTPSPSALAMQQGGMADYVEMFKTYGPQAGLAILALFSLFMMTRMARKSVESLGARRPRHTALAQEAAEEVPLTVAAASVGQAQVSGSLLTGKEVDPESLRYQELGTEVSKMVERDPLGAAELIRRWVTEL
jgi:flagellar biosynthesis/type III secretory pathway M-ring protein FliF/YscJ